MSRGIMKQIRCWLLRQSTRRHVHHTVIENNHMRADVGLEPHDRTARWYDI